MSPKQPLLSPGTYSVWGLSETELMQLIDWHLEDILSRAPKDVDVDGEEALHNHDDTSLSSSELDARKRVAFAFLYSVAGYTAEELVTLMNFEDFCADIPYWIGEAASPWFRQGLTHHLSSANTWNLQPPPKMQELPPTPDNPQQALRSAIAELIQKLASINGDAYWSTLALATATAQAAVDAGVARGRPARGTQDLWRTESEALIDRIRSYIIDHPTADTDMMATDLGVRIDDLNLPLEYLGDEEVLTYSGMLELSEEAIVHLTTTIEATLRQYPKLNLARLVEATHQTRGEVAAALERLLAEERVVAVNTGAWTHYVLHTPTIHRKLIEYLEARPGSSTRTLCGSLNLTPTQLRQHLLPLLASGEVIKAGAARATRYHPGKKAEPNTGDTP